MLKNTLALFFGLICCAGLTEGFFWLNSRWEWFAPRVRLENAPPPVFDRKRTEEARLLLHGAPTELYNHRQCLTCRDKVVIDARKKCHPEDPNTSCRSTVVNSLSGETVYDVEYHLDMVGARANPRPENPESAILFFGDSYTFGSGVEDGETFEAFLAELRPRSAVYNFGVPGSGPNELLRALQRGQLSDCRERIHAPKRIAVFTYLGFMAERVLGPLPAFGSRTFDYYSLKPDYELDESGQLRFLGTFQEARPWKNRAYRALADTKTLQFFRPFFPAIQPSDKTLIRKIFEEIRHILTERCELSAFIVTLYPATTDYMRPELQSRFELLDFSSIDKDAILGEQSTILGDGHPTPLAHFLYASLLDRSLP